MLMMIQNSFAIDTKTLEFQSQFEDNGWKYLRWKTTQKELGHCPWRPLTNQANSGQF